MEIGNLPHLFFLFRFLFSHFSRVSFLSLTILIWTATTFASLFLSNSRIFQLSEIFSFLLERLMLRRIRFQNNTAGLQQLNSVLFSEIHWEPIPSLGHLFWIEIRHEELKLWMNERRKNMNVRRKIGKYEVGRTIGEGTFAKVKFARNSETGESVAIKTMAKTTILQHRMVEQVDLVTFNCSIGNLCVQFPLYWLLI